MVAVIADMVYVGQRLEEGVEHTSFHQTWGRKCGQEPACHTILNFLQIKSREATRRTAPSFFRVYVKITGAPPVDVMARAGMFKRIIENWPSNCYLQNSDISYVLDLCVFLVPVPLFFF